MIKPKLVGKISSKNYPCNRSKVHVLYLCVSVRRDFLCGSAAYYNSPNGTIKSHTGFDAGHNYGKGMKCTWVIEAQPGWKVELVADSFDVQQASK